MAKQKSSEAFFHLHEEIERLKRRVAADDEIIANLRADLAEAPRPSDAKLRQLHALRERLMLQEFVLRMQARVAELVACGYPRAAEVIKSMVEPGINAVREMALAAGDSDPVLPPLPLTAPALPDGKS